MRPRMIGLLVVLAAWACAHPADAKSGFEDPILLAKTGFEDPNPLQENQYYMIQQAAGRHLQGFIYFSITAKGEVNVALNLTSGPDLGVFITDFKIRADATLWMIQMEMERRFREEVVTKFSPDTPDVELAGTSFSHNGEFVEADGTRHMMAKVVVVLADE